MLLSCWSLGLSVVLVSASGWKAEETEASRWRRSNSACWAAGSFGGAARLKEEAGRDWMRRGRRMRIVGRRSGIVVVVVVGEKLVATLK